MWGRISHAVLRETPPSPLAADPPAFRAQAAWLSKLRCQSSSERSLCFQQSMHQQPDHGQQESRREELGNPEDAHLGVDRDGQRQDAHLQDRKSTRLNSSHQIISYAVFCLKKKTTN